METMVKLVEWERNGYDDSDFYMIYLDRETGEVKQIEIGSTRYAGVINPPVFEEPTAEDADVSRRWLAKEIFMVLRQAEDRDILEPYSKIEKGARVKLLKGHTFKDKKHDRVVEAKEGDAGTVVWTGNFGTFYRNGYSRPNRSNGRVGIKLDDGRVLFCPMTKVRMEQDPMSDEELRERAENLSWSGNFVKLFGGAWATKNFVQRFFVNK